MEGPAVCQSGVTVSLRSYSEPYSLRKSRGNKHYYAPLEKMDISLGRSIFVSCYKPFRTYALDIFETHQLNLLQNSFLTT